MQRRILIIDDHDDLASALDAVLSAAGHNVQIIENRDQALALADIEAFDLVITDLDVDSSSPASRSAEDIDRHPNHVVSPEHSKVKAFKIGATNFRRDEFDEKELAELVQTVLDYKIRFVDKEGYVRQLREKIEFELPSAILPMHSILDYLIKRVEKLGVVRSDQSNLFVALDEAFVNAVKHGNRFNAQKLVRVSAEVSNNEACFTIEDEGEGFDVNSIPDPLDPENLFKASGRGVLFICNIMDEVKYNERGNRLTMIKKCELPKAETPGV